MMRAFTGLAHRGTPDLPDWHPYTVPARETLVIGEEAIATVPDPRRWERELWATAPYIQPGS